VPEAAVEEDDQAASLPHEVAPAAGLRAGPDVDPVPDAAGMQAAPDRELVGGVPAWLTPEPLRHDLRGGRRRRARVDDVLHPGDARHPY
jgi:hypothetical protein